MACGKKNNFCSNKLFYTNPFAAESAIQNEEEMIIASGTFNLKDIAANVLIWASGCTAANTAATTIVVEMAQNDTYADNGTSIDTTLDGQAIVSGFMSYIPSLVFGKKLIFNNLQGEGGFYIYSEEGDWALPVTQGTLNDFRVNVYIIGIQLP